MNKEEKIKVDFKLEDIPMIIETMEQLQQENKQLKERIDKAIKLLQNSQIYNARSNGKTLFMKLIDEEIKILKGK